MKKVLVVFGTRPEAIKLAPVVLGLKAKKSKFKTKVCVTAQHRQMLDQVLGIFNIKPDYDLDIMAPDQDLFDVTGKALAGLKKVMEKQRPDIVLVQGDTTTAFITALAAYYYKIPVGHVEAGLRTYDKYAPYPEEINRRFISVLADYNFAPTRWAAENLAKEDIPKKTIFVTGNTGIDALLMASERQKKQSICWQKYFKQYWGTGLPDLSGKRRMVLVTGHRRESFGRGFEDICRALKTLAEKNKDIDIVYPVHLNPNVRRPAFEILGKGRLNNVYLIEPLKYGPFVCLMSRAYIILTDSGGVQEEAPSLGKPVLVMRHVTERPEGVKAGAAKLVGADYKKIVKEAQRLLDDKKAYRKMASVRNPYGDGKAAARIISILEKDI